MVRYISEKQLSIKEFKTPFQAKLSADNRWVKLSQVVPRDEFEKRGDRFPLTHAQQRMLWIIRTAYAQRKMMYDRNVHSCPHRIVSIYQPHIRPITRGKLKSQIEFGSKLGVSLDEGFARINTFS